MNFFFLRVLMLRYEQSILSITCSPAKIWSSLFVEKILSMFYCNAIVTKPKASQPTCLKNCHCNKLTKWLFLVWLQNMGTLDPAQMKKIQTTPADCTKCGTFNTSLQSQTKLNKTHAPECTLQWNYIFTNAPVENVNHF